MKVNADFNLRHLRVFLEIVGQKSLRGAAETLRVTESAVSKSLRELETKLGVALMHRDRAGIVLTRAGEQFVVDATQVLASVARAVDSAQETTRQRETIRIGALPSAAGVFLPKAVRQLMAQRDDLDVHVYSIGFEQLVTQLRVGDLDMIIGRLITADTTGLSFEALYVEPIIAIVRPQHPLVTRDDLSIEHVMKFPVVMPAIESRVRASVDEFLFANEVKPTAAVLSTDSAALSRAYTRDFDAVWFVPRGVVQFELDQGCLVDLPLGSHLLQATIGITTLADQPQRASIQLVRKLLRDLVSEHSLMVP